MCLEACWRSAVSGGFICWQPEWSYFVAGRIIFAGNGRIYDSENGFRLAAMLLEMNSLYKILDNRAIK